ncbi:hypothetical protein CH263_13370 [Rhodococcus sp. 06-1059B-a]|nr:exonuclease domain-containing protein [Rhodococcus sp. 06-1059B-a]OZD65128.1 hypothetical protein CH263_13370 [Rhodococcus sp. 06-1059B-a]
MTNPIVFLDCETTSLRADRRAWEVAMIRIDGTNTQETAMYISDVDLTDADPFSLDVGKFYARHPRFHVSALPLQNGSWLLHEQSAAEKIERWTRGATLVGANTAFDAATIDAMLRRHNLVPSWHHRLVDVENLVAGRIQLLDDNRLESLSTCAAIMEISYSDLDLHTAMGDAELARRIFDEVFS